MGSGFLALGIGAALVCVGLIFLSEEEPRGLVLAAIGLASALRGLTLLYRDRRSGRELISLTEHRADIVAGARRGEDMDTIADRLYRDVGLAPICTLKYASFLLLECLSSESNQDEETAAALAESLASSIPEVAPEQDVERFNLKRTVFFCDDCVLGKASDSSQSYRDEGTLVLTRTHFYFFSRYKGFWRFDKGVGALLGQIPLFGTLVSAAEPVAAVISDDMCKYFRPERIRALKESLEWDRSVAVSLSNIVEIGPQIHPGRLLSPGKVCLRLVWRETSSSPSREHIFECESSDESWVGNWTTQVRFAMMVDRICRAFPTGKDTHEDSQRGIDEE